MKKALIGLMAALMTVGMAFGAGQWMPLSVPEMAAKSATHCWEFNYTDFAANTTTNVAVYITNAIPAKTSVEFKGLMLDKAFETADPWTNSVSLTVGDGSTADLFLTATELASDGTEVFVKFDQPHAFTIANTYQTVEIYGTNAVTNVTSVATVSEKGRKLYPAAGSLVATFTPMGMEAMASNYVGKVRLYFRLLEYGR